MAKRQQAPLELRNRIKELRYVDTAELESHPGNWRDHPQAQADALAGVLREVGVVNGLLAYESPRNGGKLTLIDGHLRKDSAPGKWPVLILDVDDAEADYVLSTHDPLAAMAQAGKEALDALLATVNSGEAAVQQMLTDVAQAAGLYIEDSGRAQPTQEVARKTLAERFIVPPFSVLDARQGYWQERKRAWLALGIQSELGRGESAGDKLTMPETVQRLKPSADQAAKHAHAIPGGGTGKNSAWMFRGGDGYKSLKNRGGAR